MHDTLTLLPEVEARLVLAAAPGRITLRVLRPPYPALGVGKLRVLRVREAAGGDVELTAGYENYERLNETLRSPVARCALTSAPVTR